MILSVEDMAEIVRGSLETDSFFRYALEDVIKPNANGLDVWVVGGSVYRPIAHALHGGNIAATDIDVAINFKDGERVVPEGWNVATKDSQKSRERSLRGDDWFYANTLVFNRRGQKLDLFEFPRDDSRKPSLAAYLADVSLDIQSIAYDYRRGILVGDVGIDALRRGVVGVNNLRNLEEHCNAYGLTPQGYLQGKARSLGFGFTTPKEVVKS